MKNILNNLTEEEKNNIRKQHSIKLVSEQISTEPNTKLKTVPEGMLKILKLKKLKSIGAGEIEYIGEPYLDNKVEVKQYFVQFTKPKEFPPHK